MPGLIRLWKRSATQPSLEVGKLADIVLWKPAFFGAKPSLILKGGFIAAAPMGDPNASFPLPERRQKSRQLVKLDNGTEARLFLPRGTVLRHGDLLRAENGVLIQIQAAPAALSKATTDDPLLLARVCYHLGNRHVPVAIGPGWVCYLRDSLLDRMVEKLRLIINQQWGPFEPEAGAYGGYSHGR